MKWSQGIRQVHRWMSIVFTVAVMLNIGAMIQQIQAPWIGFLALVPLLIVLPTGLYLFALPYLNKTR